MKFVIECGAWATGLFGGKAHRVVGLLTQTGEVVAIFGPSLCAEEDDYWRIAEKPELKCKKCNRFGMWRKRSEEIKNHPVEDWMVVQGREELFNKWKMSQRKKSNGKVKE